VAQHEADHHGHAHLHEHRHVYSGADYGRAFAVGIALNLAYVIAEATFGALSGSLALLADAGHNLGDVLGLIVAWGASLLVKRAPSARYTYGLRSSSILAALFNAVVLLVAVGAISWEAVQRFWRPEPVAGATVMIVAAIGIVINGLTAWLFASGRDSDLNLRAVFTHMAADALVAAGVVVAGFVILQTNWFWLDPLVSLAINAVIVWGTWGLLRETVAMSMAAVPRRIDPSEVRAFLESRPGVAAIHDLHIWSMSTTEIALTCHMVMPSGHPGDAFLRDLASSLAAKFKIGHPTLQVETDLDAACALASDEVV
jgi:cobalt-zinc-cadmium efflux system protein